ncbi:hypothetical protein GCM10010485_65000 [Streptosporangium carneum]
MTVALPFRHETGETATSTRAGEWTLAATMKARAKNATGVIAASRPSCLIYPPINDPYPQSSRMTALRNMMRDSEDLGRG